MPRFFLPPDVWTADSAALTGDEARHVAQVLRSRVSDKITVFDGQGRRAEAEILSIARDRVALRLEEAGPARSINPRITLAQAIPKGKNMDLIVQKAVELGVSAIQPLVTRNTIVQPGEGKSAKWRRNALEACKQCGQDTLPDIGDPLPFDRWLAGQTASGPLRLLASLAPGAEPLKKILRETAAIAEVILLVGPEGDFTPAECQAALNQGFLPVTLGEIVLRVETASLFCISAVRYEFSDQ